MPASLFKTALGRAWPLAALAFLAAALLAPFPAGAAVVKLSASGICHDESSPWYGRTKNFKAFDTMEECLKHGRAAKGSRGGGSGGQTQAPAAQGGSPVVKLSKSGICHDQTSPSYGRTKNFTPFNTMEECLKHGRAPKGYKGGAVSGQTQAPPAQGGGEVVKLSKSGICHDQTSAWYHRTTNFTPFSTMEECLKRGRAPRGYKGGAASGQAQPPASQGGGEVVKLSKSGICHDQTSAWYHRTTNFTPFNTMEECLKRGRAPKGYRGGAAAGQAQAPGAQDGGPAVKLSKSGICHDRTSPWYLATMNFTPFDTLEECLRHGRLPRGHSGVAPAESSQDGEERELAKDEPGQVQGPGESPESAPAEGEKLAQEPGDKTAPDESGEEQIAATQRYRRSDYGGWADEDGDCKNTRHEMLEALSTGPLSLSASGCHVIRGRWVDPYSGKIFMDSRYLDIDHLVPVKWAHDRGAYAWESERKAEFYNDERNLFATDSNLNREKRALGPAQWLPPNEEFQCQYVLRFRRVVKIYGLEVPEAEAKELLELQESLCEPGDEEAKTASLGEDPA